MGNGNKVEFLVAICALVSSLAAVYIAWDQSRVMRTQQEAEVWPLIQITQNTDYRGDTVDYSLVVENAGVGPALIEAYEFTVPGETGPGIREFMAFLLPDALTPPGPHTYSGISGRVLSAGDDISFLGASWEGTPEHRDAFRSRLDAYISGRRTWPSLRVCYCSLLEDCWISNSLDRAGRPEPVSSCEVLTTPDWRAPRAPEAEPIGDS